jgi:hypothetical protein
MAGDKKHTTSSEDFLALMFINVLTIFSNLHYLDFDPFDGVDLQQLSFNRRTPTFSSSTLTELRITVADFDDCLDLLDGRLSQLRTLYVNITFVSPRSSMNKKKVGYFRRSK